MSILVENLNVHDSGLSPISVHTYTHTLSLSSLTLEFIYIITNKYKSCLSLSYEFPPKMPTLFFWIISKIKSLSNLYFKKKSNRITFDRDFILNLMQKKWAFCMNIFYWKLNLKECERNQKVCVSVCVLLSLSLSLSCYANHIVW